MITFVVTTYNLPDWMLRRCLTSIVEQGLPRDDYEIIVVDDESEVSPQGVVGEFARQASIVLYTQPHRRQGAARNLALNHARGTWVQFVDGDDYLFPHTVAPCIDMAEDNGLDVLRFGYEEVYGEEAQQCRQKAHAVSLSVPTGGNEYMLRNNLFGSCCTLLFRRELCADMAYGGPLRFTENIYIEDEEFVTKLMWRARRVATTSRVVYAYYQREGSTTRCRSRQHADELLANYFVVLGRLQQFEASLGDEPHGGVTRKVRFLAIDILRRVLREPDWQVRWRDAAARLGEMGLYPIPWAGYSWRYTLFGLLARIPRGRAVVRLLDRG